MPQDSVQTGEMIPILPVVVIIIMQSGRALEGLNLSMHRLSEASTGRGISMMSGWALLT